MKYAIIYIGHEPNSRSPCGERGLKLSQGAQNLDGILSLPVRGAWVEMELWSWTTLK